MQNVYKRLQTLLGIQKIYVYIRIRKYSDNRNSSIMKYVPTLLNIYL